MHTALADPPAAPPEQQPASSGSPGGPPASAPAASESTACKCANCGAALAEGQDWCLQCGAGAPDSLRSRAPSWRSAAVVLTALALLVAGAAGAAYAALSKGNSKPRPVTTAVAQTPPVATTTVPPASGVTPPTATPKIGVPTTIKPLTPSKPPKIPLSAPTPSTPAISTPTPLPAIKTPAAKTPKKVKQAPVPAGEAHPEALLLDTNAAATYNPYNYAASNFGDPSLAIDGDVSTGWTALVEPSAAPKLAEGLIIDLNTSRKLSALALTTTTPGMTMQVYGANGAAPPTSITDPAWVALTPSFTEAKRHARIKLGGGSTAAAQAAKQPHRFIVLWISQAPASAVGTPQAPGRVSVNELELFARKSK
ncbi:MAG TPA: hypothetical protein VHT25_01860 [Solirubrobacteraceae bacterium]|nr:hypothetical protein [Solirubrobacteraceae bacterium]